MTIRSRRVGVREKVKNFPQWLKALLVKISIGVREKLKNFPQWLKAMLVKISIGVRDAPKLTKVGMGLMFLAVIVMAVCLWAGVSLPDLALNIAVEIAGVVLTILVVDYFIQSREMQRLKEQLIREMGSADNGIALHAVYELDAHRWLKNGALQRVSLFNANLQEADLGEADLRRADLHRANLKGAILEGTKLQDVYSVGANLRGARLWGADLRRADLRGTDLQKARLWSAKLQVADLREIKLQGADLLEAKLQRADLRWAKLDRANLEGADLQGVLNLDYKQLAEANGLRYATMPDGSRYDGSLKLLGDIENAREDSVNTDDPAAMADWYGISVEEYRRGQLRTYKHLPVKQGDKVFGYDVKITKTESLKAATLRDVITTYSNIGQLFREVYVHLRQCGVSPALHMAFYYDTEYPKRNVWKW